MPISRRLRALAKDALGDPGSDRWSRAAFVLLLLFAAIGPFLYGPSPEELRQAWGGGAVTPSGTTLISLFAFLIAALTFSSSSPPVSLRPLTVPLGAITLLAVLGAAQLFPLPEGVLRALAPVNLKIYHETKGILSLFGRSSAPFARISIAPFETAEAVVLLLTNTAFFLSAASLLRSRARRRLFVGALLGSALVQIILASVREAPGGRLHGTFRNADHFAGYLEISLAVAFGVLWVEILTNRERVGDAKDKAEKLEKRLPPMVLRILVWGSIAAGIALTQSRGGLLAAGITTCVLLGSAVIHRRARSHRRAAVSAALALLFGILFVAVAAGSGRFYRFLEADPREFASISRMALWRASLEAWHQFPAVGSGLGTFREAFRGVQPRKLVGVIEHAHDDLLQLLVTGGAVGAALGVVLVASLLILLLRTWRRQMHREESGFALAGFGALLTLSLHGLVDFSLSIPVIPAMLACVLGLSWAAGTRSGEYGGR